MERDAKLLSAIGVAAFLVSAAGLFVFARQVAAKPRTSEQRYLTVGEIHEALGIFAKYANDDKSRLFHGEALIVGGVVGPVDMCERDASRLFALGWIFGTDDCGDKSWSLKKRVSTVDALTRAARGIDYPSEADAPFDVIGFTNKHDGRLDSVCRDLNDDAPRCVTPITIRSLLAFDCDYEDEAKAFRVEIENLLTDIHCYRVGPGPKIRIYIIGRAKTDGQVVVIKTVSVET